MKTEDNDHFLEKEMVQCMLGLQGQIKGVCDN